MLRTPNSILRAAAHAADFRLRLVDTHQPTDTGTIDRRWAGPHVVAALAAVAVVLGPRSLLPFGVGPSAVKVHHVALCAYFLALVAVSLRKKVLAIPRDAGVWLCLGLLSLLLPLFGQEPVHGFLSVAKGAATSACIVAAIDLGERLRPFASPDVFLRIYVWLTVADLVYQVVAIPGCLSEFRPFDRGVQVFFSGGLNDGAVPLAMVSWACLISRRKALGWTAVSALLVYRSRGGLAALLAPVFFGKAWKAVACLTALSALAVNVLGWHQAAVFSSLRLVTWWVFIKGLFVSPLHLLFGYGYGHSAYWCHEPIYSFLRECQIMDLAWLFGFPAFVIAHNSFVELAWSYGVFGLAASALLVFRPNFSSPVWVAFCAGSFFINTFFTPENWFLLHFLASGYTSLPAGEKRG